MEASAHWKFISRNNMSLNCKIGIERESMHCYQSTRLIKKVISLCAQKQTLPYWDF